MYKIENIINTIICGDTIEELNKIPQESIDMIITSPPYWGMRNYNVTGQIGLENSFEEYLNKLLLITNKLKRVLKKDGSLWINMGDVYASSGRADKRFCHGNNPGKHKLSKNIYSGRARIKNYPAKSLLLKPERLAIKMIDEQRWILRQKIIWAKQILIKKEKTTIGTVIPFPKEWIPSSAKDRFILSYEYLYHFTKNKRYYFNLDNVRIPLKTMDYSSSKGMDSHGNLFFWESSPKGMDYHKGMDSHIPSEQDMQKQYNEYSKLMKNIPMVWQINYEPHSFSKEFNINVDHFAAYPSSLLEIPILASCPEGGIILDPFMGSGTTALMAKKLNRNYVGIELNQDYIIIANMRLDKLSRQSGMEMNYE